MAVPSADTTIREQLSADGDIIVCGHLVLSLVVFEAKPCTYVSDDCARRMCQTLLGFSHGESRRSALISVSDACARKDLGTHDRARRGRLGVSLAAIGYHFGSKEALLTQALVEATGEWVDELGRVLASDLSADATPMEQFELTWSRLLGLFSAHRQLWAVRTSKCRLHRRQCRRCGTSWPPPTKRDAAGPRETVPGDRPCDRSAGGARRGRALLRAPGWGHDAMAD